MPEELTYLCPSCGHEVRVGADCPGCPKQGAIKTRKRRAKAAPRRRSWEQDSYYDGMDLPDEDFDYDDFVAREFGAPHQRLRVKWYWWVLGIIMILVIAAGAYQVCWG